MALTAPYSNAMRIGQGFNTYTQEIRIEGAVQFGKTAGMKTLEAPSNEPTAGAQRVQPAEGDKQTANVSAKLKDPTEPTQTVASGTANKDGLPAFQNSTIIADTGAVFNPQSTASAVAPFVIPNEPITCGSQSVTFSTRAIDNLSDVMDALNISAATSIKYGTVHGNASAAFVNEGKVLESQLNYVVSVKVNNTGPTEPENMEFMPIEGLPAERFTEVYGDCFISGFIEGGEFNAIISISVQDKSKLSRVKEAVDLQLAVGPTPVSVGAKESFEKDHQELLEGTEITISVNWIGGGEIKRPEVPWTLANVVGVANAFPSMVARRSARTSAILMRYTSLKSFQAWRWKMAGNNPDSDWTSSHLILNYAPCALYTADLFDAMMVYKRIWKKIGFILSDTSKWRARDAPRNLEIAETGKSKSQSIENFTTSLQEQKPLVNGAEPPQPASRASVDPHTALTRNITKAETFHVSDEFALPGWALDTLNNARTPVSLDPLDLNEARLACREAMTLITEESARLVNHPELAYADYDPITKQTRMKRPIYPYPEILRSRLPKFIHNDAADDAFSHDAAVALTKTYARENDLFCHIVGDVPKAERKYHAFTSLALSEKHLGNCLTAISVHGYHHHLLSPSRFSKDAQDAIGAIGFRFLRDEANGSDRKADNCTEHYGNPSMHDPKAVKSLELYKRLAHIAPPPPPSSTPGRQTPAVRSLLGDVSAAEQAQKTRAPTSNATVPDVNITRIDISYVPGTGRIAAVVLYDTFSDMTTERLAWRQWGTPGKEPEGLVTVKQFPPTATDGRSWRFIGIAGDFDHSIWGDVLARVSGVWRRV